MTMTMYRHRTRFLSTPSARRATPPFFSDGQRDPISIHALREEGDHRVYEYKSKRLNISIHAFREEGDQVKSTKAA